MFRSGQTFCICYGLCLNLIAVIGTSQHSLGNFVKKYQHFSSHIGAMDSLFEAVFSPLAATGAAPSGHQSVEHSPLIN